MKVLVVDDNQLNSKLVSLFLKRLGWDVASVESGNAALQWLREEAVDMILLDLRMPALSGEQTCRALRDEPNGRSAFVVAYTAHGMKEERDRIRSFGFDELLIKPITFTDVKAICAKFSAFQALRAASTAGVA